MGIIDDGRVPQLRFARNEQFHHLTHFVVGRHLVDKIVSVDGINFEFRIIEGGGRTILLEAGGGSDLSEWDSIAPEIAQKTGATVVSYSRAGFGKSDLPKTPCTMIIEAKWMWAALKKLGLATDVILVGHSYGGWMIRAEASMNPEVVSGIVFVDPFSTEFVDKFGVAYLDKHPMCGNLPFDTSQPENLTREQRALVRMVNKGLGPKTAEMRKTTVPEGIPVFIIKSALQTFPKIKEQEAWSEALDEMAGSIEGAVVVIAENSNHMINVMQPDLIVEMVVKAERLADKR